MAALGVHSAALTIPTAYNGGLSLPTGVPSAMMAALDEITAALAVTSRGFLPLSVQNASAALDVVRVFELAYKFTSRGVSMFVSRKSCTRIVTCTCSGRALRVNHFAFMCFLLGSHFSALLWALLYNC
jgi:hypothetical protein